MPPARLAPLSLLRIIARLRAQAHRQFHIRRHPMERGCGRSATNRVARVLALLGHPQEVFYVQRQACYHPSRWRPGRHLAAGVNWNEVPEFREPPCAGTQVGEGIALLLMQFTDYRSGGRRSRQHGAGRFGAGSAAANRCRASTEDFIPPSRYASGSADRIEGDARRAWCSGAASRSSCRRMDHQPLHGLEVGRVP